MLNVGHRCLYAPCNLKVGRLEGRNDVGIRSELVTSRDADRVVTAMRTNLAATRARAATFQLTLAVLLDEFDSANAIDLVSNETIVDCVLARCDAILRQAEFAIAIGRSNEALALTDRVALDLVYAERLVGAAAGRLSDLRSRARRTPPPGT